MNQRQAKRRKLARPCLSALLDEAATRREKHLKSVYNSLGVQFRAP